MSRVCDAFAFTVPTGRGHDRPREIYRALRVRHHAPRSPAHGKCIWNRPAALGRSLTYDLGPFGSQFEAPNLRFKRGRKSKCHWRKQPFEASLAHPNPHADPPTHTNPNHSKGIHHPPGPWKMYSNSTSGPWEITHLRVWTIRLPV